MTARASALAVLAVASGCNRAVPIDAEPFELVFREPPSLAPSCGTAKVEPIGGTVSVRLFVSRALGLADAADAVSSLPAYFSAHGVTVTLEHPVRSIAEQSLIAAGDPAQALAPLRRFLAQWGRETLAPGVARVNLVVLPRVAAPEAEASRYFTELEGVSLSSDALDTSLRQALDLRHGSTPTILLGVIDIRQRRPGTLDLTAAHELGHALGLEHEPGSNLMAPRPLRCVPALSVDQRRTIAVRLGVVSAEQNRSAGAPQGGGSR